MSLPHFHHIPTILLTQRSSHLTRLPYHITHATIPHNAKGRNHIQSPHKIPTGNSHSTHSKLTKGSFYKYYIFKLREKKTTERRQTVGLTDLSWISLHEPQTQRTSKRKRWGEEKIKNTITVNRTMATFLKCVCVWGGGLRELQDR